MRIIKILLKGISGFCLVLTLALSFAPATERELSVLGPDYTRREIVQVRLATGLLRLDRFGLIDRVAAAQEVPSDALRIVLTDIANGKRPGMPETALADPGPSFDLPTTRSIDGPRFVTVD